MNHDRPNSNGCKENGIAFGEAVLKSSPPSRSRICDSVACRRFNESGFGGWADENIKTAREAAPLLSRKKIQSTTFDNISRNILFTIISTHYSGNATLFAL